MSVLTARAAEDARITVGPNDLIPRLAASRVRGQTHIASRSACSTRSAPVAASSCSQMRTTLQPAAERFRSFRLSLSTFAVSLRRHHAPLAAGLVPCSGPSGSL